MTYLPDLRESLVKAAAREYPIAAAGKERATDRLRSAPLVFALAVTVAVAVVAFTSLRHTGGHEANPATRIHHHSDVQLGDILSVLSRPQSRADMSADRAVPTAMAETAINALPPPITPIVRLAAVTPWGDRVFIIAPNVPSAQLRSAPQDQRQLLLEGGILTQDQAGNFTGLDTPASLNAEMVQSGQAEKIAIAGRGFGDPFRYHSTVERVIVVVPDGVRRVRFIVPRQPAGPIYGSRIYPRVVTLTAPVRGNVAAVQIDRVCCERIPMVWYGADGRILKRVGDFAAAARAVAPPSPGSETALSRAAERDPATPNPVSVMPVSGGVRTAFHVHFDVLLNGADYYYKITGSHTGGTNCMVPPPGQAGNPNALRGDVSNAIVVHAEPDAAFCPGTYHLSVGVIDLGIFGGLKRPGKPFGSATFTIR